MIGLSLFKRQFRWSGGCAFHKMLQCLQPAKVVAQESKQRLGRYWRAGHLRRFVIQIVALGWSCHVLKGMSHQPQTSQEDVLFCGMLWQIWQGLTDRQILTQENKGGFEILAWTTRIKHDLHLHVPCSLERSQKACSSKLAFHPLESRSNVSKQAQKLRFNVKPLISNLMASTGPTTHRGLKPVRQMDMRRLVPPKHQAM